MTTENQRKIKELAKKYGLNLVLLFGSQLRDKKYLHQESDFDVAYLSRKDLSGKEMIDLNCDLMDLFHSDRIDQVNLKKANPFLSYEIAKNCKLIFGDRNIFSEFKITAFKKYIDHLPLLALRDVLIKKRHKLLRELIYG